MLWLALIQAPEIDRWIRDLGSEEYEVREAATQALVEAGHAAVPALARAASSGDPEVATRAFVALKAVLKFESTLFNLATIVPSGADLVRIRPTNSESGSCLNRTASRVITELRSLGESPTEGRCMVVDLYAYDTGGWRPHSIDVIAISASRSTLLRVRQWCVDPAVECECNAVAAWHRRQKEARRALHEEFEAMRKPT